MTHRSLTLVVPGLPTSDGAGVRLTRSIGSRALLNLDPFLLLDEFRSEEGADYAAGFPDHPHRGFETVTYMLAGAMHHKDHAGNEGHLRAGSVQWMTAGRGIVHSEMPEQEDGLLQGFQLWVNLPAAEKMTAPRYQDIAPEDVPEVTVGGARVRIVAGAFAGTEGAVRGIATAPLYLDVSLSAGQAFEHALPAAHTAFLYPFEGPGAAPDDGPGTVVVAGRELARGHLGVLGDGERVAVSSEAGARFLLVAGKPLGEPIARLGPFVMNTQDELRQAVEDFQAGRFV